MAWGLHRRGVGVGVHLLQRPRQLLEVGAALLVPELSGDQVGLVDQPHDGLGELLRKRKVGGAHAGIVRAMLSRTNTASAYTLEALDHGVRLITAPLGQRNSASVALMFKIGSRYEPEPIAGVSHFVEHMVFKGSRRYPTAKAVAEAIEGVGGELNAATDKETTVYWARVPGDKLANAIEVLTDIVQNPILDPEEVEKERDVILEELRMYLDSPGDHVHTVFEEELWPHHPLGIDIAGTEESVRAIGVDDIRRHLQENYLGSDLVVAVAGNVDHAAAIEMLQPTLAAWPEGRLAEFVPAEPLAVGSTVRLLTKPTEQAHVVFGTRCVDYHHPDRFALDLMNCVLGEGMSCRLFLEVRENLGLCYDIHSWTGRLADTGSAGVYLGTEPRRAQDAVEATMAQIHRICEEPVGKDELTKAREYLKGRLLLRLEGTGSLATWLGGQELLTGRILEPDEIIEKLDAITPDDIMRVASDTYARQPLRMAAIAPIEDSVGLQRAISWS
jgi:predicted Zn-dependent peptidase